MVKAAELISYVQRSNYSNSCKHVISYQVTAMQCAASHTSLRTALHTTLHYCTALHTALHCTAPHCIQHYTTLHCIPHCTHFITHSSMRDVRLLPQECGQHVTFPEPCEVRRVLGFEAATVCLKTIMDQCYTEITDEEEDLLFIHAPEVISHFRSEGSITDAFLDTLGIPKLPADRHIDCDGMVPWRRHAYMMSHTHSKKNFVNYLR